ncbi:MAG TPA: ATP-binding protein [Nitrospiraceae bacterium]|nr:ATP-binding protein [Nitrospiraceae bacterium]
MRWLGRLTLGRKFLLSFGLLMTLLGLSLAAILFYLSQINSYIERHKRITVPAITTAADMRKQAVEMHIALRAFLEQPAGRQHDETAHLLPLMAATLLKDLETYRTTYAAHTHPVLFRMLIEHRRTDLADHEEKTIQDIAALVEELSRYWTAPPSRSPGNRPGLAITEADARSRRLQNELTTLMDIHAKIDAEMKEEGDSLVNQARLVILALIVLLGLLIVATYVTVSTQIAHPLRRLAATADRVAHHDLSASFDPWPAHDEVGNLAKSLGSMLANLRERTAALERKTRELESFTYSIAHDLKAPLREIEGFSSLLGRQFGEAMDPTARHYVAMTRASALRMTALIDDLLRYSRLEQQRLPKSAVNLRTLVDEVLADRLASEPGAAPRIAVDLPFTEVWGEPAGIRQALINLVDNAFKFSRGSDPRMIAVGGRAGPGERVLWVRDTGVGFESTKADMIFGLFERLHGPDDYEGTGIGLAIVKLVMEKHGGRVWAESSPGKGSVFYLAFPEQSQEGSG